MPQPMKVWRVKARQRLIEELGGVCVDCGKNFGLVISHITPLTNEQSEYRAKIGANKRLVLYRKEAKENLVTLRCQSCNINQSQERGQGFFTYSCATVDAPF